MDIDIDIDIDKYIRPAWIIDRRILENILEKDFLHLCKAEGLDSGCVVLYCPSLETFDPYDDDDGVIPLKKMWVDTYGGKNANIVLLIPWNVISHCPPDWLGVEHLTHLVNWLGESYEKQSNSILPKQFGEVAKRIQVLLCNLNTITAGSRNPSIDDAGSREPYAFGIYFHPCSFDKLNKFLKKQGQGLEDDTIKNQVQLILGTSIGKPFSIFNNGKFTYNLFLRFNGESAVPKLIRDEISCVVLEHIKLVVEAFKGRCCPDIQPKYINEFSMQHGVASIKDTFMPFWVFLSLIFLQIDSDKGKLQLTVPNKYQDKRLTAARLAARPNTESTD